MNHSTFLHIQLFHDDYLNDLMLPDDPDAPADDEEAICDMPAEWLDFPDTPTLYSPPRHARC
jgi:hypothetical protein